MKTPIYQPQPIKTDGIDLPQDLQPLLERLAKSTHDNWALQRLSEGWKWGPERSDKEKTHPGLVAYEELAESEKEYDRRTVNETLKSIIALGYKINKT